MQSDVVLTKYWLFPDGVGVFVDVVDSYLGILSDIEKFYRFTEEKFKKKTNSQTELAHGYKTILNS